MKEVTVRQIAQAMLTDRTPKTIGMFDFKYEKEETESDGYDTPIGFTAACAIGGAAFELGLDAYDLQNKLADVDRDGVPMPRTPRNKHSGYRSFANDLAEAIYTRNDDTQASKSEIGKLILKKADEATLNTKLKVVERGKGDELGGLPFIGRKVGRKSAA